MLTVLQDILCYISKLPTLALYGGIYLVNGVVSAIGAFIDVLAVLLPSFPAYTSFLPTNVLQSANWFYPFGALVDAIAALLAIWLVYLVVRIALHWVKALNAA